jgi:hypothetical protein
MNIPSSRDHSIATIEFTQLQTFGKTKSEKK